MRKSFPWSTWLFYILFFIAFLTILNIFSFSARSVFFRFTIPLQSFFWEKGSLLSGFLDGVVQGGAYRKQNIALQKLLETFEARTAELETFQKENKELKNALDIGLRREFKLVGANVTGKEISRDAIFIDRGSADGILKGMAVITPTKVAAGEVVEVYEQSSVVLLLSDRGSSFEASINDTAGLVKGAGRSQLLIDLIPRENDIQEGDVVFTSHLGSVFPPNIPIGEIQKAEKNDTGIFQKADIRPFFNMNKDSILFVIF